MNFRLRRSELLALTGERLWLGLAPKYLETLGAGVFIIGLLDAAALSGHKAPPADRLFPSGSKRVLRPRLHCYG
jgi:hypothetical protein